MDLTSNQIAALILTDIKRFADHDGVVRYDLLQERAGYKYADLGEQGELDKLVQHGLVSKSCGRGVWLSLTARGEAVLSAAEAAKAA